MIEQNVQVVRCEDERMWVHLGAQSGCTACDNGKGCGAGVFAKLLRRKPVIMELSCHDPNIKEGQMVTLAFPERVYLKLVLTYYGWPLVAALAGAFAGHGLSNWVQAGPVINDVAALLGGIVAGGLVLRVIKEGNRAKSVLSSLHTTVYIPSATNAVCGSSVKPEH